ncbi:trans-sialidase, putative, partial [Trypanosoma cruzi marinkellei]
GVNVAACRQVGGVVLTVSGTSADCFPPSSCTCRSFSPAVDPSTEDPPAVRCGVRRRWRSGCAGSENSKTTGGSAWVLRGADVPFCIPLVDLCVGVARYVLARDERSTRRGSCWRQRLLCSRCTVRSPVPCVCVRELLLLGVTAAGMMVPLTVDGWRCLFFHPFYRNFFLYFFVNCTVGSYYETLIATVNLKALKGSTAHTPPTQTHIYMHSRVAAVTAPRTHDRRRVTGSSGRRREGRESEPQRPNMSRRVFTSAVLLLPFVMMCCGIGGAVQDAEPAPAKEPSPRLPFDWRDTAGGETVGSLRVPSLVEVDGGVFAVAEAQCTKDEGGFTGIASELLELSDGTPKEELSENKLKTQVLDECSSEEKRCLSQTAKNGGCQRVIKVHVSRPTTVVNGSDIYMLAGNYSNEAAAASDAVQWGLLLVRGNVSGTTDNEGKRIYWNDTDGLPWGIFDEHKSLTRLIGSGGWGVKMQDGSFLFPVEGTKEEGGKTVSLILYWNGDKNWKLSKEMSADGCSDPSVVEWKDGKLMMMTACDDGRRRVYESGDKGESWTEALGTLSRVWGKKQDKDVKLVRSGFITATIDSVDANNNRNVMLVTLPVYPENENEKGELHLWLTDNTHIVDIGPVSGDDDAAASSLLYKSAGSGSNAKKDELIALYEKKNVGVGEKPSPGMVSVLLKKELERVKTVLTTWKEVDERVSKLCRSLKSAQDTSPGIDCSAVNITDGLVGFLSGNFSNDTWRDEYLGVNATVTGTATVATEPVDGVTFTGRGAGAEWPVGSQGENQLYHFANYNFTLVATVSIDGVPTQEGSIPLMGAKMKDGAENNPVLLGLSYDGGKKMAVLHSGGTTTEHSITWELGTKHQVAIVLKNEKQGSVYVDGQLVGGAQRELGDKKDKGISHFYIGGDAGSTGSREGVSVTVRNVLLYNRPLSDAEITALNANKVSIPKPDNQKKLAVDALSPAASGPAAEGAASQSYSGGPRPSQQELKGVGAEGGGASSAASTAAISLSNDAQTVATGGGGTMQGNGSPQTPEVSVSSGGHGEETEGTDARGEGIHAEDGGVTATALNSSLGNLSRGNNSDASTVCGSGLLPLFLLLLGLWGVAAL